MIDLFVGVAQFFALFGFVSAMFAASGLLTFFIFKLVFLIAKKYIKTNKKWSDK